MNKKKKKGQLEVGKRYRGYGVLNEYGEFNFEPENTGSRAGIIKQIVVRDGVNLSHTKDNIIVLMKIRKSSNQRDYLRDIMQKVDILLGLLREYDI